jgi:TatA/E family protein of Tat protein translocase
MFGSIGMPELVIILVIALIIFGPRKLPELGKSLGKSINEFKKASTELQNTLEKEIQIEEQKEKEERINKVKKHKKFRLLSKKDTSQKKLHNFFSQKTNKDGYPLHHCRYHPELKEYIYIPPGYGRPYDSNRQPALFESFCNHCMLAPCLTDHLHYDAQKYAKDMAKKDAKVDVPNSELRASTAVFLQTKHCKLFKKRYSKKLPILTCINEHVKFFSHGCGLSSDEESDSDSESENEAEL